VDGEPEAGTAEVIEDARTGDFTALFESDELVELEPSLLRLFEGLEEDGDLDRARLGKDLALVDEEGFPRFEVFQSEPEDAVEARFGVADRRLELRVEDGRETALGGSSRRRQCS
jgi:hypothetical protein